jgi:hypothetical protein
MSCFYSISRFGLAFAACLFFASAAPAAIVAQHLDDNDPTTEGFTAEFDSDVTGSASVVGPSWLIEDNNSDGNGAYVKDLTGLLNTGDLFTKTVVLQVGAHSGGHAVAYSQVGDGLSTFLFSYTPTGVYYFDASAVAYTLLIGLDTTDGFHTYAYTLTPGATDAVADDILEISVDNGTPVTKARSDFYDFGSTYQTRFGAGSNSATGYSYWMEVTVNVVPEPSSALLAVIGFAGLLRARKRRNNLNA